MHERKSAIQMANEQAAEHAKVLEEAICEYQAEQVAVRRTAEQTGGSDDRNEYRPWEVEGITEIQYWRRRYLELSKKNHTQAERIAELRAGIARIREAVEYTWIVMRGEPASPSSFAKASEDKEEEGDGHGEDG